MIDAAGDALTAGDIVVSVAQTGSAKPNATASAIAANIMRKIFLPSW
jgi:hypothetical protein